MQKPVPESDSGISTYKIDNPEEFTRNMLKLIEEGGRAMTEFLERSDSQSGPMSTATEMTEATKTMTDVARAWLADPVKLAEAQNDLWQSYFNLWNNAAQRMMGQEVEPVAEPEVGDNRFKDPEWSTNPYFDFWKQSYLLTTHWAERVLEDTELDERTRTKAEFYFRQMSAALSPSNFPITNPEVMRETFASNAKNLVQGMHHLVEDISKSDDLLRISQTDTTAFEVGKNLATTPGKVVFQNDIIQLIQYSPTTEQVHEVPLLIVPPWINKFYILDLNEKKSFVKYAIDQGFTVFLISWVNPDERLSHKTFEDYMTEGVLAATDAVKRETGVDRCNTIGYCVGGTLLSTTLAYLAARGEKPIGSATFFTTQVDFTKAGDLLLFIDDTQLTSLEEMMAERGYLDGSRMANVFNLLRPRDLIWPYVVNNYLLGKKPFPFDLLYWNQDSTRMPADNHNFYLREFYQENKLAKGDLKIAGQTMDLSKVKVPVYHLAAKEDHIAPAESVFIGAKMYGGPVEFVLAGSGHIAGVINPPGKIKYQYWTSRKRASSADNLGDWFTTTKETAGSWWPHWSAWLAKLSGDKIDAREPGANLGVIEEAPGSYVKAKA